MSGRSTRTAQVRVGSWFTGALQDLVVSDPLILEAPAPTQVDLRPCSIPKCHQYGGMKADDAKRLKELEKENTRLEKIVADQVLDIDMLRELNRGNF